MASYKLKDIRRVLGINRTTLQQWLLLGFLTPTVEVAQGHGNPNRWSREDVIDLGIFQKLLEHGFARQEAAEFLKSRDYANFAMEAQNYEDIETYAVRIDTGPAPEDIANYQFKVVRGSLYDALKTRFEPILDLRDLKIVNITGVLKNIEATL